jgi:DNA repair protein RadC
MKGETMIVIKENKTKIKNSEDIAEVFQAILKNRPEEDAHKECFYVAGLDSQNRILYVDLVTMGTINSASPVIREVFRLAIMKDAVSIIVSHNHPSGVSTPSVQDINFTRELLKAGNLLGISLLDHIIIGDNIYSFADSGNLN